MAGKVKLTKGQLVFLQIARDLGGTAHVFLDQLETASWLAARGLVTMNDNYFNREATLTDGLLGAALFQMMTIAALVIRVSGHDHHRHTGEGCVSRRMFEPCRAVGTVRED